ncbi:hypothetical protein AVEN_91567-1, partial [Araneus ventricosus]
QKPGQFRPGDHCGQAVGKWRLIPGISKRKFNSCSLIGVAAAEERHLYKIVLSTHPALSKCWNELVSKEIWQRAPLTVRGYRPFQLDKSTWKKKERVTINADRKPVPHSGLLRMKSQCRIWNGFSLAHIQRF